MISQNLTKPKLSKPKLTKPKSFSRFGLRGALSVISIVLTAGIVAISLYGYFAGWFNSISDLQEFISSFGMFAPVLFIFSQVIQVVVPVIPNPVLCVTGVAMFGPVFGFIYNYIGICIGSMVSFYIARLAGPKILPKLFSEKLIYRYSSWVTKKNNVLLPLLAVAISLPIMPDDFICYLAGTTKIKAKHFTFIILFGRTITISLYSIFFHYFYNQLTLNI